ncbi:auxin response factor 1 isoform X3 [Brachypodium distachyon]|uniref:Auxin response factor n=1 Tax=Brachypodium distachyon TaxID=15368 RepID=A0A0Q3FVN5_BRADI|nr:auxin response factor 1 isoform X3 [Brachypodium distachyon]KQK03480.1 hypothetical protein BRADI_2g08120v3 [Brachypodium distachyon]|eukprot:XP_003565543.2 auxin response factor 1 isoform X3 [Brachypodium distachyon]
MMDRGEPTNKHTPPVTTADQTTRPPPQAASSLPRLASSSSGRQAAGQGAFASRPSSSSLPKMTPPVTMPPGGGRDAELFSELWRACAGPLVELPQPGQRVFYFLQGHLEQVQQPSDQKVLADQIKMFQVPYKILCRVVNVELKAEVETEEVYAQITLLPEQDQEYLPSSPDPPLPEVRRPVVHSFSKILTPSDTSTHGGFSVLRRHANECLPPLDMSMPTPTQELICKDILGSEWRFKHIYRGQPRRHLLTTGWSTFVTSKKLVYGDAFVYLRTEEGEQRVGVRHHVQKRTAMPSSVMSSQSMHLGVLASASHALQTKSIFLVYYRPRVSQSQYIVNVNKYFLTSKLRYTVGVRFKMSFEGEEVPVKKFSGTIVGDGALSPQWSCSEWKSKKVQWDDPANCNGPERVSPWEIEPADGAASASTINVPLQSSIRNKRPRETTEDLDLQSLNPTTQEFSLSGMPRQHDKIGDGPSNPNRMIPGNQVIWPGERAAGYSAVGSSSFCQKPLVRESWLEEFNLSRQAMSPTLSEISQKLYQVTRNDARAAPWPVLPAYQAQQPALRLPCNTALHSYRTEEAAPSLPKVTEKSKEPGMVRLFGVNLMKPTSGTATADNAGAGAGETSARVAGPCEESGQVSALSRVTKDHKVVNESPREIQSNQSCIARNRVKVQMHGNAVGRAVDLANLDGYEQLIRELEQMFDIKDIKQNFKVAFADNDGDTMKVGDDPWMEFCRMVKKIVIYPLEEEKMEPHQTPISAAAAAPEQDPKTEP